MPIGGAVEISDLEAELSALGGRMSALRQTYGSPADEIQGALDAILLELDAAEELIRACIAEIRDKDRSGRRRGGTAEREHRLLRQAFRDLPIPLFLLDGKGAVRRVNNEGAALLGFLVGYLTGKSFPLFVDLSHRAVFRSHLSAVLRTGTRAAFDTRVIRGSRTQEVRLALAPLTVSTEPEPLVTVIAMPPGGEAAAVPGTARPAAGEEAGEDEAPAVAAARRLDVMTRMSRLLLSSPREPRTLAPAAELLAEDFADWVVADLTGEGREVAGPDSDLRKVLGQLDPAAAPAVREALETGTSRLHELIGDEGLLGTLPEGRPVLPALDARSVLTVPIAGREAASPALRGGGAGPLGALTLVRVAGHEPFGLADLGLAEDLGEHLALFLSRPAP
ncbi:PAS domain-containing protein [Bailinhaonella thermotolerans]|nr:PAS domain-containing protein [Bailinhaonella thermotolerans]